MSLLRSPAHGGAGLGWRRITVTALVFCLAPALLGALIVGAVQLFGSGILGAGHLRIEGIAGFAMISPLLTAPVWGMIALAASQLAQAGWFGSLPTALLGAAAYGVLAWTTGLGLVLPVFGAVSALLYRMALALQRPEAV